MENESRTFVDIETGEVVGIITFPVGTPEKQWELALNGVENVRWELIGDITPE